jgi:diketogulonate reductase-like aldo/keto reductase
LYLLHWRERVPLSETVDAFAALKRDGKIRYWGVSNFDVGDMEEVAALSGSAAGTVATNQILYNLMRRGAEHALLPWCLGRGIPITAYSPLEQGKLVKHKTVKAVARQLNASPAQVALAWVLRRDGVLAIPKSGSTARVRENRAALQVTFAPADLVELEKAFPGPVRDMPLEMI